MLSRLTGLENEYAIRFRPTKDFPRPGNEEIYHALAEAISACTSTAPSTRRDGQHRIFCANGGSVCYEHKPTHPAAGLIECATPECRGPSQLLIYQRAQEDLLLRAIPLAEDHLGRSGYPGELSLLRNARDADGQIYGPQENYEVTVPTGIQGLLFRGIAAICIAWLPIAAVLMLTVLIATLAASLLFHLVKGLGRLARFPNRGGAPTPMDDPMQSHPWQARLARLDFAVQSIILAPAQLPLHFALKHIVFRRFRFLMSGFLCSRSILSGTGTLDGYFNFQLSEKALGISRVDRAAFTMSGHSVFDHGHLLKCVILPLLGELELLSLLFKPTIRLQLGLSDANRLDVAEYLKLGSTLLVIDMIEAGFIDDAPQVSSCIDALHAISADPELEIAVYMQNGDYWTGLDLQRWYLDKAKAFVRQSSVVQLEAETVVKLWHESLDALNHRPESLIGQLDWVTKLHLINEAGGNLTLGSKKKIDLKYHELGTGYASTLEQNKLVVRLADPKALEHASDRPPGGTPAWHRGQLIRQLAGRSDTSISWLSVRLKRGSKKQVISLRESKDVAD